MERSLIELRAVSKYFGTVVALKDVSFAVSAGEVHCLLGDNGAGKSTLIKMLSGVYVPDDGEILVAGGRRASLRPRMRSTEVSPPSIRILRWCRS